MFYIVKKYKIFKLYLNVDEIFDCPQLDGILLKAN